MVYVVVCLVHVVMCGSCSGVFGSYGGVFGSCVVYDVMCVGRGGGGGVVCGGMCGSCSGVCLGQVAVYFVRVFGSCSGV